MRITTYKCDLCGNDFQGHLLGLKIDRGKLISIMDELPSYDKHICKFCVTTIKQDYPPTVPLSDRNSASAESGTREPC